MGSKNISKRWIKIKPASGLLVPNEKISISITIFVDYSSAHILNENQNLIDDLLILRLFPFNDYFVCFFILIIIIFLF